MFVMYSVVMLFYNYYLASLTYAFLLVHHSVVALY